MTPSQLAEIKAKLKNGQRVAPVQVREFLGWFGYEKRGYNIVQDIRQMLSSAGVGTIPDFDRVSYYSEIGFVEASGSDEARVDPTIRLSRLNEATRGIRACSPQEPLNRIVPVMIMEDYSQIPVMTSQRDLKGIISWQSIASALALAKHSTTAREVMVAAEEAPVDLPLSEAIERIARQGYILIRAEDKRITGIVTSWDLNEILMRLSAAFLALGEIEGYLRRIIHGRFTGDELSAVSFEEGKTVSGPHELTLGEIIRLIEVNDNWDRLQLAVDRADFINTLNRVRDVRNDVMHFDPDGISSADQGLLNKFVTLLREIA